MTSEDDKTTQKPIPNVLKDDEWFRQISQNELETLGVNYVAYVKPVTVDGVLAFGIFGADGQQLGVTARRDMALEAIRENDLEPLSVH